MNRRWWCALLAATACADVGPDPAPTANVISLTVGRMSGTSFVADSVLPADGESEVVVRATIDRRATRRAIAFTVDQLLTIGGTGSERTAGVTANPDGHADLRVRAGANTGTSTIAATIENVRATATLKLIPALPDYIVVSVTPGVVEHTGPAPLTVTASLRRNQGGGKVTTGVPVIVEAYQLMNGREALRGSVDNAASLVTNASGEVTARVSFSAHELVPDMPLQVRVRPLTPGAMASIGSSAVTVTAIDSLRILPLSQVLAADGTSRAVVTAWVNRRNGTKKVTFQAERGAFVGVSGAEDAKLELQVDPNGLASATLRVDQALSPILVSAVSERGAFAIDSVMLREARPDDVFIEVDKPSISREQGGTITVTGIGSRRGGKVSIGLRYEFAAIQAKADGSVAPVGVFDQLSTAVTNVAGEAKARLVLSALELREAPFLLRVRARRDDGTPVEALRAITVTK